MKIKILLFVFLAPLLFSACKKDSTSPGNGTTTQPGCVTNNTGVVYFKNKYPDPYNLEINGSSVGTVSGGSPTSPTSSAPYTTSAGSITYEATQASGYWLYPDVYSDIGTVPQCSDLTITF